MTFNVRVSFRGRERERDNMLHLGTRVKQKKRIGSNLDQSETTQRQD